MKTMNSIRLSSAFILSNWNRPAIRHRRTYAEWLNFPRRRSLQSTSIGNQRRSLQSTSIGNQFDIASFTHQSILRGCRQNSIPRRYTYRRVDAVLKSLENNVICARFQDLERLPYLCTICGKNFENRFVEVIDRWWLQFRAEWKNGRCLTKPTSTVFHLGNYNQTYDGVVIRKLGVKSMTELIDAASTYDFCSLPERDDVLSFLTGLRNLILDPGLKRVVQPSLKPQNAAFFKNLEKYLREKSIDRKSAHCKNPLEDDDWLFMLKQEPFFISHVLCLIGVDATILRKSNSRLLPLLCDLSKQSLEHFCGNMPVDNISEQVFLLYTYAMTFIIWNINPDKFAPGSWRKWYECFTTLYAKIGASPESMCVHELHYLTLMLSVARLFRKFDDFAPVIDKWLSILDDKMRTFSTLSLERAGCSGAEFARAFTDLIYGLGLFSKYLTTIGQQDVVVRLEPALVLLANCLTRHTDPRSTIQLDFNRFLTGLRDFQVSMPSISRRKYRYPADIYKNLEKYIDGYVDHASGAVNPLISAANAASMMLLLSRLYFPMTTSLWLKMLLLFQRNFVGQSEQLFQQNPRNLYLVLLFFGEAAAHYGRTHGFSIEENFLKEYFSASMRFLELVEPPGVMKIDNVDEQKAAAVFRPTFHEYKYVLSIILRLVDQFDCVDYFRSIKPTWEQRSLQVVDSLRPKNAFYDYERIQRLSKCRGIQFDQCLIDRLVRLKDGHVATQSDRKTKMN